MPVGSVKAKEPKDPEIILADSIPGVSDETDSAFTEICQRAKWIDNRPIRPGIQRVDVEISPRGVFADLRSKRDGRMPSVGLDVAAKGRYVDRFS